jgi:hypothetical protein
LEKFIEVRGSWSDIRPGKLLSVSLIIVELAAVGISLLEAVAKTKILIIFGKRDTHTVATTGTDVDV